MWYKKINHQSFLYLKKEIDKAMKITFNDLNIKEKLAIISACAAFTLGWVLTGIAAFVPLLLSEQSILWILGQGMTYSAAVFGVSMYFNAEARQMRDDMQRYFNKRERLMLEREKLRQGIDIGELPNEEEG